MRVRLADITRVCEEADREAQATQAEEAPASQAATSAQEPVGKTATEEKWSPPDPKDKIVFHRGSKILSEPILNPLWLVQGLLPEGGVCVIGGEPKSTKTWLGMELGMALSTATPALGEYEVHERKNVAIFLAEDGKRSVQARLTALASSRDMEPKEASENMFISCRGELDILDNDQARALVDRCKAIPDLGLLVLDPLRDLHTQEENDATAMAKVTKRLRDIRDLLHCSVLFVHHAHKSGQGTSGRREGQRMRGSSVIHGAIDAGIYLSGTETDMQSYWTNKVAVEIKEGAGAGRFKLTLNLKNDHEGRAYDAAWEVEKDVGAGAAEAADDLKAGILAALTAKPQGVDAIAAKVARRGADVRFALKEMVKAGQVVYSDNKNPAMKGYTRAGDASEAGVQGVGKGQGEETF